MEDFGDLDKQFRCRGGAESLTGVGLREKGEESQYVLGYRGAEKWSGTWKGKLNQGIFFFFLRMGKTVLSCLLIESSDIEEEKMM